MRNLRRFPIVFLSILLLATGCANVTQPTGGPKDETPPEILFMNPANATTQFEADKIVIEFDEFIQLKDFKTQFIISPPTEEKPKAKVKGKRLEITIPDSLAPNTTYNLFFGNAIQDFNEGNPLSNFRYVFSTGVELDSMSLRGTVLSAFDKKPLENTIVMLYHEFTDSTPMKRLPDYVANIDEEGNFRMAYLAKNEYTLFALTDENDNYLYDDGEPIAFLDSLVTFSISTITRTDTVYAKDSTVEVRVDQLKKIPSPEQRQIDTIITYTYQDYPEKEYRLYSFIEPTTNQYIKENKRDLPYFISIVMNAYPKDSVCIKVVDEGDESGFIRKDSENLDSISIWLTDTAQINRENIELEISYPVLLQRGEYLNQTDTLSFSYFFSEKDTLKPLSLNIPLKKNKLDLKKNLNLLVNTPINRIDSSKIQLSIKEDSVFLPIDYELKAEDELKRHFILSSAWEADSSYKLMLAAGAFTDIYGQQNDTIQGTFQVQKEEEYGKLLLNFDEALWGQPLLVQLWDNEEKQQLRQMQFVANKNSSQAVIELVHPGEYKVKLVFDDNGNQEWDGGDLFNKKQPERAFYHPEVIKVRANWDLEVEIQYEKLL